MALWVMRRAGRRAGAPEAAYDAKVFLARLPELSRRLSEADRRGEREPLDYNAPADGFATDLHFYIDEAYHGGRLRQGWGVPELSLTHPNGVAKAPEDWMMDYLFAIWKYWSEIEIQMFRGSASAIGARLAPYARQASGRYSILNRMLRMSVGDIIFVPATSAVPGEEQDFSVATIAAPYKFSPRVDAPKFTFLRDYGHVIQVNELQAVPYSARTLAGTDFRPHRYAVNGPIAKKSRDRYLRCLRDLGYVVGP